MKRYVPAAGIKTNTRILRPETWEMRALLPWTLIDTSRFCTDGWGTVLCALGNDSSASRLSVHRNNSTCGGQEHEQLSSPTSLASAGPALAASINYFSFIRPFPSQQSARLEVSSVAGFLNA